MNLSVIVLTKNSAQKLPDCLTSVKGLDEIVLLDGGSTDATLEIGKKYGARVVRQKAGSFDTWRNQGKEEAKSEWLFYVDPDERVTPELLKEILEVTGPAPGSPPAPRHGSGQASAESVVYPERSRRVSPVSQVVAFAIPRRNFVFGKELKHGGWWPDYVIRLIRRDKLIRWQGKLHEQPMVKGKIGYLKNPFMHLKEDNLSDMVAKTNKWSEIEARLLLGSGHPKMAWWRFIRPVLSEVFDRLILKLGFLDGVEGIIFSLYQGYSRFMTYAKLWEMQQKR